MIDLSVTHPAFIVKYVAIRILMFQFEHIISITYVEAQSVWTNPVSDIVRAIDFFKVIIRVRNGYSGTWQSGRDPVLKCASRVPGKSAKSTTFTMTWEARPRNT